MPTRRSHTKTRHGCLICKQRKVRCDEEKPACRNCMRGDRVCTYPNHLLAIPAASAATQPDAHEQIFPLRDLELLHYWTCYTYTSVTEDTSQYSIWQIIIPRMAFSYRFLLHGMLALTALHRRYESNDAQRDGLMDLARYHQQHALTHYIPMLQSLDENNCHALFAFSIVLGALSFGLLHDHHDHDLASNDNQGIISRLVETFDAFLGATAVGMHSREWLLQGPLHSYIVPLEPMRDQLSLRDTGFQGALEALAVVANSTTDSDESRRIAYKKAIYGLGTILAQDPSTMKISDVVAWPVIAETSYIALLKQRDPLALLVLGHYGVALHLHGSQLWMLENLGKRLTEAIYAEVDQEWRPYLDWAKVRVGEPPSPSERDGEISPVLKPVTEMENLG